jgi:hypothetical protein
MNKPRNINMIIDKLLITIKKHEKNSLHTTCLFRDLQSTIMHMAPEVLKDNHHWVGLVNLLTSQFPMTPENKETPFMKEMQLILSGQETLDANNPSNIYQENEEEKNALVEYMAYKGYFNSIRI